MSLRGKRLLALSQVKSKKERKKEVKGKEKKRGKKERKKEKKERKERRKEERRKNERKPCRWDLLESHQAIQIVTILWKGGFEKCATQLCLSCSYEAALFTMFVGLWTFKATVEPERGK